MDDAHDVPARMVHHVLGQHKLDLFDSLLHLAEARHVKGAEGQSLSMVRMVLKETVRQSDRLLVQLLIVHTLYSRPKGKASVSQASLAASWN